MTTTTAASFVVDDMQPNLLKITKRYILLAGAGAGVAIGLLSGVTLNMVTGWRLFFPNRSPVYDLVSFCVAGLFFGLVALTGETNYGIYMATSLSLNWQEARSNLIEEPLRILKYGLKGGLILGLVIGSIVFIVLTLFLGLSAGFSGLMLGLIFGLTLGLVIALIIVIPLGILSVIQIDEAKYPGQKIYLTFNNYFLIPLYFYLVAGLIRFSVGPLIHLPYGKAPLILLTILAATSLTYSSLNLIFHYTLRLFLTSNNLLPMKIINFLNDCVDLTFLRRVGGGYIFVHRLLMEHFAEMYVETPTSKGN